MLIKHCPKRKIIKGSFCVFKNLAVRMTSHLRLRSAAYGNPEPSLSGPVARSRPGLVLIDKPRLADSSQLNLNGTETGRSSVMSDDILKLARIEAKRIRRAKSAIDKVGPGEVSSSALGSQLQTRTTTSDGNFSRSGRKQQSKQPSDSKKFTNISSKINNKSSSIGNFANYRNFLT